MSSYGLLPSFLRVLIIYSLLVTFIFIFTFISLGCFHRSRIYRFMFSKMKLFLPLIREKGFQRIIWGVKVCFFDSRNYYFSDDGVETFVKRSLTVRLKRRNYDWLFSLRGCLFKDRSTVNDVSVRFNKWILERHRCNDLFSDFLQRLNISIQNYWQNHWEY